ncbi:hypothetical protein AWENTII_003568 [Aspergillus wentii]
MTPRDSVMGGITRRIQNLRQLPDIRGCLAITKASLGAETECTANARREEFSGMRTSQIKKRKDVTSTLRKKKNNTNPKQKKKKRARKNNTFIKKEKEMAEKTFDPRAKRACPSLADSAFSRANSGAFATKLSQLLTGSGGDDSQTETVMIQCHLLTK